MATEEATAVYSKITGYVRLRDADSSSDTYPLSSITASFLLNSIPWAQIVIPVGKSTESDDSDAVLRARELAETFKQFKEIEAWLAIDGSFAPDTEWPSDYFRVFSGYVTGTSIVRSTNTIAIAIQATHWLIDLDASSALSDDIVSGSPVAIVLPGTTNQTAALKVDPADPFLLQMADDMWTGSIKRKFIDICERGNVLTYLQCGQKSVDSTNDLAKRRLEENDDGGAFDRGEKIDVPQLALDGTVTAAISASLAQATTNRLFNGSLGMSSLWDKLLELAQLFQFSIVPNVDSACCAPVSPCLAGDTYHTTIRADEYWDFKPSEATFRQWRGVSVAGNYTTSYGAIDPNADTPYSTLLASGCYMADSDEDLPETIRESAKKGTLQFISAPEWVEDKTVEGAFLLRPSLDNINNTMADVDDETNDDEAAESEETTKDNEETKTLGDLYAKWWYWAHQFLSRTGELTGKLRFDIAPGSIVRIEDVDGKLYAEDAEVSYLYAMVTSVRFNVDATNAHASTSFTFSHVRRHSERDYGTTKHPLYSEPWLGTVLQNLSIEGNRFVASVGNHETAA